MSDTSPDIEEVLFDLAVQKPSAAERAAFLDGVCDDNHRLRIRLEKLLTAHFAAEGFLPQPAQTEPAFAGHSGPAASDGPSPRIGNFKLLEKIGEGGFGEVWMADQVAPVKRRVALKIVKLGMDSRQVVSRFEAERQALAMMDHANIARIFDAGTTDTGRPYFVMELVRGVTIIDYCDQNRLPTPDRLRLFMLVCHAIQHAHQKGIIHRDIKPSNILVTLHDGVPVPKVIDFGIAKAMQQELTEKTVFTQFAQFVGTPAYISPEQAETSGLDLDTRADIYSLGVLLYELLVGKTPFDAKEMVKDGLDTLRRIIREKEPATPSTKLKNQSAAERTSTATRRRTDAVRLIHQLRGDLDWIVMKCLEKDRTRRYDTANGLAMDIQRHLGCEPVLARPPSKLYEFQKTVRRHKFGFAATAAIILVLAVGVTLTAWQALRATRAREAETEQRVAADSAREQALTLQKLAEDERASAEVRAYASAMNLAQQALVANNFGLVNELLERHSPSPDQPDRRGWEWRYLWGQSRSDATYTLGKQSGRVNGLSVSHDGKWLAVNTSSNANEGDVSVWNLASRQEVMRVGGKWGGIAFSPVKSLLALWDAGLPERKSRIRVWDAETGQFGPDLTSADTTDSDWLYGMTFSADGQTLITASPWWTGNANELCCWRLSDGKRLAAYPIQLRGPGEGVPVNRARDANLVALAEEDRVIRVIDSQTGDEKFNVTALGQDWLESVALSADGKILAASTGMDETNIRLWDVPSGLELGELTGHQGYVIALAFSANDKLLASAGVDQSIRIWDVQERRLRAVLRGHRDEVRRLAFLPDNATLISGARDGTVMAWDATSIPRRQARVTLPPQKRFFWAPVPGNSLLTIERSGELVRWSGPEFQQAEPLLGIDTAGNGGPFTACLSANLNLLATGGPYNGIQLWDVSQRKLLRSLSSSTTTRPLAFLVDDSQLAVWNEVDGTLATHDVASRQLLTSHPTTRGEVPPIISPDGRWYLDSAGNLGELATGRVLGRLTDFGRIKPAFSGDGKFLAAPNHEGFVRWWDVATQKEREPFRGFLSSAFSVAFSPDARRLAVGSVASESLKLFDLESGQLMLTLPGEGGPCWTTRFSPDGNTLITEHELGHLDVWHAPSWAEIAAAEENDRPKNQSR